MIINTILGVPYYLQYSRPQHPILIIKALILNLHYTPYSNPGLVILIDPFKGSLERNPILIIKALILEALRRQLCADSGSMKTERMACQGLGLRVRVQVQGFRIRVQGLGLRVRVQGFRIRVQGFRVQGLGLGLRGLGFKSAAYTKGTRLFPIFGSYRSQNAAPNPFLFNY